MKKLNQKNVSRCLFVCFLSGLLGCSAATPNATNYTCEPLSLPAAIPPTAPNQAPLLVGCGYFNEPCVTVTICVPNANPANCQTIPNVLLDTGSVGLRLFSCAVTLPLVTENDSLGNAIGDYVGYLDGSCDWGPVKTADVYIGSSEAALGVPIQIIDKTFATVPDMTQTGNSCVVPDYSAVVAGFNGILGVGLSLTDCYLGDPSACQTSGLSGGGNGDSNFTYFSCNASGVCTNVAVTVSQQVTNPVSKMNHNNNGVILTFPAMSLPPALAGNLTMTGSLTLGIGTAQAGDASNGIGTATVYETDRDNNFQTNNFFGFDNAPYSEGSVYGFIDSGSNTLAFPVGQTDANMIRNLLVCSDESQTPGFYCPATPVSFTANQASYLSAPQSNAINVTVANASSLLSSSNPNFVFNDVASSTGTNTFFDWGFPFFIGQSTYVHIIGATAAGGTAAGFWAW